MDIDPTELVKEDDEPTAATPDAAAHRLNTWVAITVALLATFLGICKVKDDNIVQAMQQAQADRLDDWSFYQARNLREEVMRATAVQVQLSAEVAPPAEREHFTEVVARYEKLAEEQAKKKAEVEKEARTAQERYDALNFRDDQFDLADALGAIAVSLLAMTALTHRRALYFVALVPTALCVLMGLSGLAGWHVHPDTIAQWLS